MANRIQRYKKHLKPCSASVNTPESKGDPRAKRDSIGKPCKLQSQTAKKHGKKPRKISTLQLIGHIRGRLSDRALNYQLAEHISLTHVDDEAVLLDLNVGSYFGLNAVGAEFLELLKSGSSLDDAVAEISDRYEKPREIVAADLAALIDQLLDNKLIVSRR